MTIFGRFTPRAALCALALLAAAPSLHAQPCRWDPERPGRGPEGRRDSIDSAIRDSQRAAIVGAAAAAGVAKPRGLVASAIHRSGSGPLLRLFDANFPAAALDPVAAELVGALLQHPHQIEGQLAGLVRLDPLPMPPLRADGKRRNCWPVLRDGEAIRREMARWKGPSGAAAVLMVIDREGRVRHVEIVSRSGISGMDDFVLQMMARTLFVPATVDGVPRDMWVSLPIFLE